MAIESLTASNIDLEGLSDVEDTFHFTDSKDLGQAIHDFFDDAMDRDSLCDHTILVIGFPAESFIINDDDDTDNDDEPLIPRKCKILYLENSQSLFVTMATSPHETASEVFARMIDRKLMAMNCADEGIPAGTVIRKMINVQKMPDKSWRPRSRNYITLALETGVSESERALARDAKIWLEHSESHVAQVVTIKISRARPEIFFSVWKTIRQERGTRAEHTQRATEVQKAHVTLAEERPVADGRICLSFEELFERKPRLETAEKDIAFSARELGGIARVVWEDMGFISLPRLGGASGSGITL
jgi:hypothetical protein